VSSRVEVVWDDAFLGYRLGDDHPMHPVRLELTIALARLLGVLERVTVTGPEPAGDTLLELVHDRDYIDAVRRAPHEPAGRFAGHGLGTPDNPVFPHMHEASALVTGGTVRAAEAVWTGRVQHAVNVAGGLHHAMRDRASGFCVYNDTAVAIRRLLDQGAERIAYVDVDAHHGDGVQAAFYDEPRVLTVSLHETGRTLFPGTGFPDEIGEGKAAGTSVNVALPPGTGDGGFLRAFHAVVPAVVRAFEPQILVSQCGCDGHAVDPLTDLMLTVDGQRASYEALHRLAHEVCDGRFVAVGGGGYGVVEVVPRAWTHLLAEVAGAPIDPATAVPDEWRELARTRRPGATVPTAMTDGSPATWKPWGGGGIEEDPVDRAILATRTAVMPLHALDPHDPRDV
jgi:acetoin utilization protein AcuC